MLLYLSISQFLCLLILKQAFQLVGRILSSCSKLSSDWPSNAGERGSSFPLVSAETQELKYSHELIPKALILAGGRGRKGKKCGPVNTSGARGRSLHPNHAS